MNFETLFGGQKPIIGMVHLRPLPGAPNYGGQHGRDLGRGFGGS